MLVAIIPLGSLCSRCVSPGAAVTRMYKYKVLPGRRNHRRNGTVVSSLCNTTVSTIRRTRPLGVVILVMFLLRVRNVSLHEMRPRASAMLATVATVESTDQHDCAASQKRQPSHMRDPWD